MIELEDLPIGTAVRIDSDDYGTFTGTVAFVNEDFYKVFDRVEFNSVTTNRTKMVEPNTPLEHQRYQESGQHCVSKEDIVTIIREAAQLPEDLFTL